MSYAGSAYGFNMGGYNPQPATMGNDVDMRVARARQLNAYRESPDYEREMHERGLQAQEQQRRQYDSETQRQSQERKYSLLSGLRGQAFGGLGGFPIGNSGGLGR